MRRGALYSISDRRGSRRVAGRFEIPERFTIKVDDPEIPCLIELDVDNASPEPACLEVRATRRPGGPPVTGSMLRSVRVAEYLREGTEQAVMPIKTTSTGREVMTWPPSDEEAVAARRARRREKQPNRRIPDDDLKTVAAVYRQALALGQAPTAEVERQLRLKSRTQAARWVLKARRAGYLGPAPGLRRAGEAPPEHEEGSTEHVPSEAQQQERPRRPPPGEEVHVFPQAIPPKREPEARATDDLDDEDER